MNCKKYGLILLIVFYCLCLQAQNINISGENKATFLHRTAKDSLHNYFENELKFRVDRGAFTFGMSFIAELPAYDDTMPEKELDRDKLHTRWDDLFVQLKFDDFRLKVGTIDESYGVGLILRSWNNPDVSADKRMNGVQAQYNYQDFKIKGLYGKMKEDIVDDDINDTDLVAGIDAEYQFSDSFTFGASALEYKQDQSYVAGKSYTYKEIYGARAGLSFDAFDLELESAGMKTFHGLPKAEFGNATYAFANGYLGDITVSAGYKRYENYNDHPLSDLPTLNHYDELLYSFEPNIKIEEGLQGEVRYRINPAQEVAVNYGEAWDKSYKVLHSNLFAEHKWQLEMCSITTDFEHLEKKNSINVNLWEKEVTPAVAVEFFELKVPLTLKTKWTFEESLKGNTEGSYNKPYLQVDSRVGPLSYSLFGQYQFIGIDDLSKHKVYLGAELVTDIARHTEAKLFVGSEQGGKVCRNGVCKEQAAYEGIKFSLNTRF